MSQPVFQGRYLVDCNSEIVDSEFFEFLNAIKGVSLRLLYFFTLLIDSSDGLAKERYFGLKFFDDTFKFALVIVDSVLNRD